MKIKGIPKCDFNKYNQPLNIIASTPTTEIVEKMANEMNKEIEIKVKQAVGVDVDIEELHRAMNYDRQQYAEGWNKACETIKEAIIEVAGERLGEDIWNRIVEEMEREEENKDGTRRNN